MAAEVATKNAESEKTEPKPSDHNTHQEKCQSAFRIEKALPAPDWVTLTARQGRYRPLQPDRLRNSLLAGVGFLELGNAGDFAANVWNEVPVRKWVAALMGLGATLALATSCFAFKDIALAWRNLCVLREERLFLNREKVQCRGNKARLRSVNAMLDVNFREIGTEFIDRLIVDLLLGFGALLISIGTYMAIGGANPSVFYVSNLLSGYIGNSAGALYGLIIAGWSGYVSLRAYRHRSAGLIELESGLAKHLLRLRTRKVQTHSLLFAVSGLAAGAGGLISATKWWGYAILAPCIVSTIYCNWMWRHQIGYERPMISDIIQIDKLSLAKELEYVDFVSKCLNRASPNSSTDISHDHTSIVSVIRFMISIDLFESFCVRLLRERQMSGALFGTSDEVVTIREQAFLDLDEKHLPLALKIAQRHISEKGLIHLRYRERHLLETLGCYLRLQDHTVVQKELEHHQPTESA